MQSDRPQPSGVCKHALQQVPKEAHAHICQTGSTHALKAQPQHMHHVIHICDMSTSRHTTKQSLRFTCHCVGELAHEAQLQQQVASSSTCWQRPQTQAAAQQCTSIVTCRGLSCACHRQSSAVANLRPTQLYRSCLLLNMPSLLGGTCQVLWMDTNVCSCAHHNDVLPHGVCQLTRLPAGGASVQRSM
jgi:hypothetical protein